MNALTSCDAINRIEDETIVPGTWYVRTSSIRTHMRDAFLFYFFEGVSALGLGFLNILSRGVEVYRGQ